MSTALYSLCLLAALCLPTGLAQDDGYETFDSYPGSRYRLYPSHLDWDQALAACVGDGGGSLLAVINAEQEAEVVRTLMARHAETDFQVAWMGINDRDNEGQWVTVQGGLVSESGYDEWQDGDLPSDANLNCGYVWLDALYWHAPCDLEWPFLCEKPNV